MTSKAELEEILVNNRRFAAEAIEKMGGPADAARKLTTENRKIKVGHVWAWINRDKRGIPLEYLKEIEKTSGVAREDMRGDVPWRVSE